MVKQQKRPKHIPQRTCVGCRETLPKRELIRVVRTPEGVRIDQTGKLDGRGAYMHDRKSCWEQALKGSLANALKTEMTADEKTSLTTFMESLKE